MLLYTTFAIECAHRIDAAIGVPEIHGHSYWLQVYVESSAKTPYPLHELEKQAATIRSLLDHKLLNDVLPQGTEPTMEAIIDFVRVNWPGKELKKVIVRRDTIGTGAEWTA